MAGITIVQLTGNGLFGKTELVETDNIEFSYEKSPIEGTNKIQTVIVIKDNENGLDKIEYPNGDILNCNGKNQIAIDYTIEKEVEYKFKVISNNGYEKEEIIYESTPKVYLYNYGNKCEEFTGGWLGIKGSNATMDMESYDYFDLNSQNDYYNYVLLWNKKNIDVTNYKKLKMKATVIDNGYTGGTRKCGYKIGLGFYGTIQENEGGDFRYSSELKQELGGEIILEKDITDVKGSFNIGVNVTSFHVKIHQIWLE